MTYGASLVKDNIHFLKQGIDLLQEISDKQYVFTGSPYYRSGVGEHMRHILDHYLSLVSQSDGKVDYDARERDRRIETDKSYAGSMARQIIAELEDFLNGDRSLDAQILVRSNEGESDAETSWTTSSVTRELQFLISHTVHHYALIAVILRIQGYNPPEEFGVAPSTLKYQKQQILKPTK